MTVNERVKILVEALTKGNIRSFSRSVGVTPTAIINIFNRGGSPSFKMISGICEAYPKVNANWLISGKGTIWNDQPLCEESHSEVLNETQSPYQDQLAVMKMDLRLCAQENDFLKKQLEAKQAQLDDKQKIIDLLSQKP